ncbi:MAG TPA: hypothetical protein VGX68_00210 [Thermoanaerobaculia bacterium]|jgi:hypothetical protein|nr:hypothetical protein [Thermoanaerobaculia bacterium]
MKAPTRILLSAAVVALLLPLTARSVQAQSSYRGNIDAVEIVVTDLETRREMERVDPDGTITLPEGAHVRIHMTAIPAGSSRRLLYPATEFTDATRTGVRITRSNEENAAADLDILPMRNPNRTQTVRYRITDTWVPASLRTGSFSIRVVPASGQSGYWSSSRARDLTRTLYEGILMREPDTAANGTIRSIQRGGYEALVDAAVDLADSDESRIRIYEREGVCNQQRLLAIYKNLLGLSASQITRSRWDADLRRLNSGDIAQVVEDIVRSERFRLRHEVDVLSR